MAQRQPLSCALGRHPMARGCGRLRFQVRTAAGSLAGSGAPKLGLLNERGPRPDRPDCMRVRARCR